MIDYESESMPSWKEIIFNSSNNNYRLVSTLYANNSLKFSIENLDIHNRIVLSLNNHLHERVKTLNRINYFLYSKEVIILDNIKNSIDNEISLNNIREYINIYNEVLDFVTRVENYLKQNDLLI